MEKAKNIIYTQQNVFESWIYIKRTLSLIQTMFHEFVNIVLNKRLCHGIFKP